MSMVAIVPIAQLSAANNLLNNTAGTPGKPSHGPNCFSVPAYISGAPSHGALHAWNDPAFEASVLAVPGVVTEISNGDPITRTKALIDAQGAVWGAQAPQLPASGPVTAGTLYQDKDGLWNILQSFNRTTYPLPPATYPALIAFVRQPGSVAAWKQPTSTTPYYISNPFTSKPDQCTHNGFTWKVTQADGAGNNVWEPGVFGWTKVTA